MLTTKERTELYLRREGLRKKDIARELRVPPQEIAGLLAGGMPARYQVPTDTPLGPGEILYLCRLEEGLTIAEAAEAYGVSHVTVIKWERGLGEWERGIRYWEARASRFRTRAFLARMEEEAP